MNSDLTNLWIKIVSVDFRYQPGNICVDGISLTYLPTNNIPGADIRLNLNPNFLEAVCTN